MSLDGQVALITGGGRGIGCATALALARAGADVAVSARTSAEIDAVSSELRGLGRRAISVRCDVTQPAECDAAVERVVGVLARSIRKP